MATALHRVSSGKLEFEWEDSGTLTLAAFRGVPFHQFTRSSYSLNDEVAHTASSIVVDENRLTHVVRFVDGSLRAVWTGGDRVRVVLQAHSLGRRVEEAGFSLCLPKGNLLTTGGSSHVWSELSEGQRVSFGDWPLGAGQVYFLDVGDACLRVGRQVERSRDTNIGYLEKNEQGWELVWKWQPQAPFPREYASQPVEFKLFDSVSAAVEEHRVWMERVFHLVPKEENPKVPDWFKETRLVLQVNVGETNGAIVHDWRDITHLIEDLGFAGVPEHTILYIPDYSYARMVLRGRHGPVNACWPESPLLGGRREFVRMVETAKERRFHIMPHSSVVLIREWGALNFLDEGRKRRVWHNPEWQEMGKWAIGDYKGNPIGWPPTEVADRYPTRPAISIKRFQRYSDTMSRGTAG